MSVVNPQGTRVILPRSGPETFWEIIEHHLAGESSLHWKYLAMFALREHCGWRLEQIGWAFGHPKGHITRCLKRIRNELRGWFEPPDDDPSSCDPDVPQPEAGFGPRRHVPPNASH